MGWWRRGNRYNNAEWTLLHNVRSLIVLLFSAFSHHEVQTRIDFWRIFDWTQSRWRWSSMVTSSILCWVHRQLFHEMFYRSSPSSQICKVLDWPLHRVLAHGSILGKSASGKCSFASRMRFWLPVYSMAAMVGDRIVSVCGWEGGATMRSVPVAVCKTRFYLFIFWVHHFVQGGRSNSKTVFHHSLGCCCVSASPDGATFSYFLRRIYRLTSSISGNWIVTGGFDGTVSIYKSTNRFEDFEWTPYFWNRSHATIITHCR